VTINGEVPSVAPRRTAEDSQVREFAVQNAEYYARVFALIRKKRAYAWSFNYAAALFGPVWAAARGVTALFWLIFLLQAVAIVQISVGAAGNQGLAEQARAERLTAQAQARADQARAAEATGSTDTQDLRSAAAALTKAADAARAKADAARASRSSILVSGTGMFLIAGLISGLMANSMLERRFTRWRSRANLRHGRSYLLGSCAFLFCVTSYALSAYRFAAASPGSWLTAAPANRVWQVALSSGLDRLMDGLARVGSGLFGAITGGISMVLDAVGYALTGTPWPVTMAVILLLAWQLAGPRVSLFTAAALAYLALLGFWEKSLETVALLGTAAGICLVLGIPIGIWCGRRPRVDAALRPVLDFMQTMPAFVYLIPVIAIFGIGKPPGVIATLVFGTPPVVRLTALGIRGVPASVREAAQAYGATRWFLLTRVDLPLAMPSIMTGINQTILMCLSMVVIASLIGAKGLGEDVLNALQYAAVGQGLLAGLAILLCAMVIDRIVQGRHGGPR
jgi:glycine betaine/proline transport system permease protein